MSDRAELRELAERATPGPWEVTDYAQRVIVWSGTISVAELGDVDMGDKAFPVAQANAEYIAACSPSTITALLDALDRAEAVNFAHDAGWGYNEDSGAWYDGYTSRLRCLDENLVAYWRDMNEPLKATPHPEPADATE